MQEKEQKDRGGIIRKTWDYHASNSKRGKGDNLTAERKSEHLHKAK